MVVRRLIRRVSDLTENRKAQGKTGDSRPKSEGIEPLAESRRPVVLDAAPTVKVSVKIEVVRNA